MFGLISGLIISFVLLFILQKLINILDMCNDFFNYKSIIKMSIPGFIILLIIIIVYIVVFISTILPLRKVRKINIINAIKNKKQNKVKIQNLKTPKFIYKIFGEEGNLALKNVKFQKSNYKTIVISITTSIILFLTVSGLINNLYKILNKKNYSDYLIKVDYEMANTVINYLEENNLIDDYFIAKDFDNLRLLIPEAKLSNSIKNMKENKALFFTNISDGNYETNLLTRVLLSTSYDDILKKAGLDNLKENECILINCKTIENSKYGNTVNLTQYEVRRYY